jgi:C-terminal binding-module, SLH-like, of glucodextranase
MKNIGKIIVPLAALTFTFALPLPFMFMGPLMDGLTKTLKIEVDPRYSGGEVLAKFLDPMDDDRGEGSLVYPDLPAFQGKRVLDIVKYTVRRPVLNVPGGDSPDFWQLDVTFAETANPLNAPLGFSLPVVHIYIDVDGTEGGSTRTAQSDAELVSFDPAHPWDYLVHIDGFSGDRKGRIVSHDGTYQRPVEVFFVAETKTIHARIELDDPGIKRILDRRPTYHYVLVGAYDPLAVGGFMPVAENAGPRNGGGARSTLTPRIYDWAQSEGVDQGRTLSSYDQRTGAYAVLVPLEAKESPKKMDSSGEESARRAAELLATYKEKLAREHAAAPRSDVAAEVERLVKRGAGGMELVEAYYRARMFEEAAAASRRILESEPGRAGAATYLAMAVAGQSGEQKSPLRSLEFVNRAFALFENALPLCKTPDELLTFYLQRGRYFAAVPESLFRRSAAAADDLLKAAAIIKQREDSPGRSILLAGCYLDAARALAQAGNADEAEIYFHRAAEFKDLTTGQIVTLLEHGVVPVELRRQE